MFHDQMLKLKINTIENPITKKKYPKEKVRKPFKKEYPRGY